MESVAVVFLVSFLTAFVSWLRESKLAQKLRNRRSAASSTKLQPYIGWPNRATLRLQGRDSLFNVLNSDSRTSPAAWRHLLFH